MKHTIEERHNKSVKRDVELTVSEAKSKTTHDVALPEKESEGCKSKYCIHCAKKRNGNSCKDCLVKPPRGSRLNTNSLGKLE